MLDVNHLNSINQGLDSISVADYVRCDIEDIPTHTIFSSLNLISQNIRSISCNVDSFISLVMRSKVAWDVMVLTECWLPSSKFIPTIDGFNYITTSFNKTQNEGVVIYYNKNLIISYEEPKVSDANCLMLKLNTDICIIGIYRPPSYPNTYNFTSSIDCLLSTLGNCKNVVLCGDINIDISTNTSDNRSQDYLNILASHSLLPAHTLATHGRTCLDHMMVKTKSEATCFVINSSITDHESVALCIKQNSKLNYGNKPISRVNYESLDEYVQKIKFQPILQCNDVNLATDLLVNSLATAIKANTKVIRTPIRQKIFKPWITKGLLRCMRNRDNLHKKLKKDPKNDVLKLTYKRYRNYCNGLLKKTKKNYEKQEIVNAKDNKKKLWEVIKDISGQKKQVDYSTCLLTNNKIRSINEVNSYFASVGKNLAEPLNTLNASDVAYKNFVHPNSPKNSLVFLPTDILEVQQIIITLKNRCAAGLDQISNTIIKRYMKLLAEPITHICNLALKNGIFPDAFKIALIKPIHKGGDKDRVVNYRPISILPSLSKILEKIMNRRLINFLEANDLLSSSQFGFRRERSTSDAVHELTEFIISNLDVKHKCLAVFLDLAKAFDTVSIPILVTKLEAIGVRGHPLKLFTDYLFNRRHRVKIDQVISDEKAVTWGVPQGSILGPTLFLIYINDLCNLQMQHGRVITFADDTALIFNGNSWDDVFSVAQCGLTRVCSWLRSNVLTLNVSKSNYIAFALRSNLLPPEALSLTAHNCDIITPHCNCPNIQRTDCAKYLGIYIDPLLTFRHHIDVLVTRLRKLIYIFKALKHVADRDTIKMVYLALCQSIVGYCITSWGGAAKSHLILLERAQRAILKVSAGLPYHFSTTELFNVWEVLSVRQYFVLQIVLKKHSQTCYDQEAVKNKRRKGTVCRSQTFHASMSLKFFCFLGTYLYNKVNSSLSIYPLTKNKCKVAVSKWLRTLDYRQTEDLLSPPS